MFNNTYLHKITDRFYETVLEAKQNITAYIDLYNHKRRHSSLNYRRPYEVMTENKTQTSTKQKYQKITMNHSSKIAA